MKKILYIISAIGLMVSSCTKDDNFDLQSPSEDLLHISIRAMDNVWQKNDEIGVSIFGTNTTTPIGKANTKYSAESAGFTVVTPDVNLYYPSSGNVDILAYYPYLTGGNGTSYAIDMTTEQPDLMVAKKVDVVKSKNALNMEFYHTMAELVIEIEASQDAQGLTLDDIKGIKLTDTYSQAQYDLTAFDPDEPTSRTPITNLVMPADIELTRDGAVARCFVIPQTINQDGLRAKIEFETNYGTLTMDIQDALERAITFTPGTSHTIEVEVTRKAVNVTNNTITPLTSDNDPADNNGTADEVFFANTAEVGMYYYNDGRYSESALLETIDNPILGIIYQVNANGTSGKVIYHRLILSGIFWNEEFFTPEFNAQDSDNGLANIQAMMDVDGWETHNLALVLINDMNPRGTTYSPESTDIWYIPAINELIYISEKRDIINERFRNHYGFDDIHQLVRSNVYLSSTEDDYICMLGLNIRTGGIIKEYKLEELGIFLIQRFD